LLDFIYYLLSNEVEPLLNNKGVRNMNIVRWEPFGEMVSLRNAMDRLFEDSFVKWARPLDGNTATPAVDIFDTPEKLGIRASLPGIKPEDIDISVTSEGVVIKGETRDEREIKEENYVRRECHYGTFARTIALPQGLKIDKAEATMENGVLTLEIPKVEEEKPKTVKIKAKTETKKLDARETKEAKS
jgi:HSP20 family protein